MMKSLVFNKKFAHFFIKNDTIYRSFSNSSKFSFVSPSIPFSYIYNNKPINIYFTLYDLDNINLFIKKVNNNIPKDLIYTVFIKVRYDENNFFMLGNQFGFTFSSDNDIQDLLSIINSRLEDYYQEYNLSDESIIYIQISFRQLNIKLFSDYKMRTIPYITSKEVIDTKNNLSIPLSTNIGITINVVIKNDIIVDIPVTIDNKIINFLDLIKDKSYMINNKDNIKYFDKDFKFYHLIDNKNNKYVLAIKNYTDTNIIKIRFSMKGIVVSQVIDNIQDNIITRNIGNKKIIIKDNNIIMTKQSINFKSIIVPKNKNLYISNPNIGVIDTETFKSNNGITKVYALGFRTNLDINPITYYIDNNLDSDKIVLNLIDELLRPKYSNITFYCHNLSGYDIVFILKVLYNYNDNNKDKYKISCILRNDKIIKVKITKNKNSVNIQDSYCMLTSSLAKLGKSFNVDTIKSVFPYNFYKQENLFYIGNTPDISYYNNISIDNYKMLIY